MRTCDLCTFLLMAELPVEPTSSTADEDIIPTLLNTLKSPKLSDLTRKRKVDCNPPPKGKRRSRGEGANDLKTVTAAQRVKEFSGKHLATTGNGSTKLFCTACREELSIKKNVIVSHVSSNKHKTGKEKLAAKESRERDIVKLLKEYTTLLVKHYQWINACTGSGF